MCTYTHVDSSSCVLHTVNDEVKGGRELHVYIYTCIHLHVYAHTCE